MKNNFAFSGRTRIFNKTRQVFFWLNQQVKFFFASFVYFYQQTFLATFYLIFLCLSIHILMLEIHIFNHYGILAGTIIDINCENQLSYGFFKFCRTLTLRP